MATVHSVLGPCKPEELGFTLIHEHLTAGFPGWELDNYGFDRKKEIANATEKLKEIKTLGVSSFVDPCPMELGRDPEFAAEVSDKSGVRVIMATGLYNGALGIPPHFRGLLAVGYDRIMLSHDMVNYWLGRVTKAWQDFMDKCPNWNYTHIMKNILPALSKAGVSEGTIRTMTVDNPRSYFGG